MMFCNDTSYTNTESITMTSISGTHYCPISRHSICILIIHKKSNSYGIFSLFLMAIRIQEICWLRAIRFKLTGVQLFHNQLNYVSSCIPLQQASQIYRELHPGLRLPLLRQHSYNNQCDVTTDDEIQARGTVRHYYSNMQTTDIPFTSSRVMYRIDRLNHRQPRLCVRSV